MNHTPIDDTSDNAKITHEKITLKSWYFGKEKAEASGWLTFEREISRTWADSITGVSLSAAVTVTNPIKYYNYVVVMETVKITFPVKNKGWEYVIKPILYGELENDNWSFEKFEAAVAEIIEKELPSYIKQAEDIMKETSMRSVEPLINPIAEQLKSSSSSSEASNTKNINQSLAGKQLPLDETALSKLSSCYLPKEDVAMASVILTYSNREKFEYTQSCKAFDFICQLFTKVVNDTHRPFGVFLSDDAGGFSPDDRTEDHPTIDVVVDFEDGDIKIVEKSLVIATVFAQTDLSETHEALTLASKLTPTHYWGWLKPF